MSFFTQLMGSLGALLFSLNSFACLGGRHIVEDKILLTAHTVSLSVTQEKDVNDMLNNGSTFSAVVDNGESVKVSVVAIKQDSEDIIFTIFKVQISDRDPSYIKVESNYNGNGQRMRGVHPADLVRFDESYGC